MKHFSLWNFSQISLIGPSLSGPNELYVGVSHFGSSYGHSHLGRYHFNAVTSCLAISSLILVGIHHHVVAASVLESRRIVQRVCTDIKNVQQLVTSRGCIPSVQFNSIIVGILSHPADRGLAFSGALSLSLSVRQLPRQTCLFSPCLHTLWKNLRPFLREGQSPFFPRSSCLHCGCGPPPACQPRFGRPGRGHTRP